MFPPIQMDTGNRCILLLLAGLFMAAGCGRPPTRVEDGNRRQILHKGNGAEPQDLDPHIVSGTPEHYIIASLFEGLVSEDPRDLHPVPGVAERWDISEDGRVYTFHLRHNARWSNGDPVTAHDFLNSFRRMLTPSLGAEYAYMLYPALNAEAFNKGEITDFDKVGFRAMDDHTLEITLHSPTPYFLSLLNHYSWFPVHLPTLAKHGNVYERGNRWTRPQNFVGNGAFRLKEWKVNTVVVVEKSPTYWNAANVRLNGIHFHPYESGDAEERAFRAGQLHVTYQLSVTKVAAYRERKSRFLRIDPYLGTYFYVLNVTDPVLKDKRVRRALAMAVDREALVAHVTRGGELPAYHFTPPDTAGYTASARLPTDIEQAKRLLAEAGYPNGKGLPPIEITYNTLERHKIIAEAIQQMWKKNLNIDVRLRNEEWKVFLDTKRQKNYQVARYGWIGDYVDPNTFLDMWVSGGGQNDSGWSNPEYDRLIQQAGRTGDNAERFKLFDQAESILLDEAPIVPLYFYTQPFLLSPSVKGWYPTILNHHPYQHVYLEPPDDAPPEQKTSAAPRTAPSDGAPRSQKNVTKS